MFNLLSSPAFLRALVWFDASTGLLLGALHLLLTASLAEWLGLPSCLLVVSGVLLLGYAALATRIARARTMPRGSLWVLIVANFGWALASLALLLGTAVAPTFLVRPIWWCMWFRWQSLPSCSGWGCAACLHGL